MSVCRVDDDVDNDDNNGENDYENLEDELPSTVEQEDEVQNVVGIEVGTMRLMEEGDGRNGVSSVRIGSGGQGVSFSSNSNSRHGGAGAGARARRFKFKNSKQQPSSFSFLTSKSGSVPKRFSLEKFRSRSGLITLGFMLLFLILILEIVSLSVSRCGDVIRDVDVGNSSATDANDAKSVQTSKEKLPYHEVLLLRQDLSGPNPTNESRIFSPEQFLDFNSRDPTAKMFSRMKDVDEFRRADGNFRFLLCYPLDDHSDRPCYDFVQSSNPLNVTEASDRIEGFQMLEWLGGIKDDFSGLRSDSRPLALMDGSPSSHWYWAVGSAATYLSDSTIPGPPGRGVAKKGITSKVELYAVIGDE